MASFEEILNKAEALFLRYGIKSITMDDVARHLGISKKTLYQFVENKADLIGRIFRCHIDEEKDAMAQITAESADAIDEILKIAKYVIRQLRNMSPAVMYDLQKYYRDTWRKMESLNKKYVYEIIKNNIDRGIAQGLYRPEIDSDIVAKLYVGKTSLVADEELFPLEDYRLEQLFRQYILYHIHGIASQKGLATLSRHLDRDLNDI